MFSYVFIPKEAISAIELTGKFKEKHTHTTVSWPLVRDNPGRPVREETLVHSHPSWSSDILYHLPPFTTINGILFVHFTCLTVLSDNLSPSPQRTKVSNKCIAVRKVATPLRELTCHVGSHSVTCHPAEVTFPPLLQPTDAGTRLSDPGGMQGWVDLVGLLHTEMVYPPKDGHPSRY